MVFAVPPRKGLLASGIAAERPELSPVEVAKLAGTDRGHAARSIGKTSFGRDKPKRRAKD